MFRILLLVFGAAVVGSAVVYLVTGRRRYLDLARRIFLGGLVAGVVFFAVLLLKRLI